MSHLTAVDIWNFTNIVEYNDWIDIDEEQKPSWASVSLCPPVAQFSAVDSETIYVASNVKNESLAFIKFDCLIVDCLCEY